MLHSMRVELGQADSCHSKEVNDTTLLACPSLQLFFFLPQPGPNVWLKLGKRTATRFRSGEGK